MTEIKPHAAHWGYFDAVVENGRVTGVRPFGPDPFPGSLIESVPDVVHAACRDRPALCAEGLAGGQAARPSARRRSLRAGFLGQGDADPGGGDGAGAGGARRAVDLRRLLRLVLGRALPSCEDAVAALPRARRRLHLLGHRLFLCDGADAAAAYPRHQRGAAGPYDGLAGDRAQCQADDLPRRAGGEERAGEFGRRRAARLWRADARGQGGRRALRQCLALPGRYRGRARGRMGADPARARMRRCCWPWRRCWWRRGWRIAASSPPIAPAGTGCGPMSRARRMAPPRRRTGRRRSPASRPRPSAGWRWNARPSRPC